MNVAQGAIVTRMQNVPTLWDTLTVNVNLALLEMDSFALKKKKVRKSFKQFLRLKVKDRTVLRRSQFHSV